MPLPQTPTTVTGGCNCKAIRYKVEVPAHDRRAISPYRSPGATLEDDVRLPMIVYDHCNDCRRATAAILPAAMVLESWTVSMSFSTGNEDTTTTGVMENWQPVDQVLLKYDDLSTPEKEEKTATQTINYLSRYKSSPGRNRWFCSRCGTPIGYSIDDGVVPVAWAWPKMVDLWLGTVDREILQEGFMKPERMLWCEMGVPWIRELASHGAGGIPEHPLTKLDRVVGDDIQADLDELRGMGKEI